MNRVACTAVAIALGGVMLAQQGNLDDYNHIPRPPYPPSGPPGVDRMSWADRYDPPKGPVARIVFRSFNLGVKTQPPPVLEEVVQEFDELGHKITEVGIGYPWPGGPGAGPTSQSKMVMTYQGGHMTGRDSLSSYNGQPFTNVASYRWEYDSSGHLVDFWQGNGDRVDAHYTDFKYDREGRPLGFVSHGRDDRAALRIEHRYAEDGSTITTLWYLPVRGDVFQSQVLTLDEKSRIIGLEASLKDYQTKQLKRTTLIRFRYDERGRLVEQDTDQSDVSSIGGYVPSKPGKMFVTYDDAKRTQEISSYTPTGAPMISKERLDEKGAVASLSMSFPSLGAVFSTVEPECNSDSHGNWTDCKEWLIGKGERTWSHWYTRTITYR